MGFVKPLEEMLKYATESSDFYDAETLTVIWETRPLIVKRLLPPPLKPAKRPIAMAFIANYPRTNFDVAYRESALFLWAEFNGVEGMYCLAMLVTNDIAMAGGREIYGYPKKMADVKLKREDNFIEGWTKRRGSRFMKIKAQMTGRLNTDDAAGILSECMPMGDVIKITTFNFKHFLAPEGMGFDYNPRLVSEDVMLRPSKIEIGEAKISFRKSEYDPWFEVKVVRMLGAIYSVGNNSMMKGKVVAEVNPLEFAPYAFIKWDFK